MNDQMHKWQLFYSPRNGRISIQACSVCGVAKGMVRPGHKCIASNESKIDRLNGWTAASPAIRFSSDKVSDTGLSLSI